MLPNRVNPPLVLPVASMKQRVPRWLPVLLSSTVLLSGCAAFSGHPDPSVPTAELAEVYKLGSISEIVGCFKQTGAAAKACRDQILTARMYAIDLQYSDFERRLFRQTRESGFAATLATLGLTTTAALTTAGASQWLSGIAALTIGGREAFQKEVLAERTLVTIHTAMRAKRAQFKVRLLTGVRQPTDDYPLLVGLTDLREYEDAGSILGALTGITESSGAQFQAAQKEQDLIRLQPLSASSVTPEARKLRQSLLARVTALDDATVLKLVKAPPVPQSSEAIAKADAIARPALRERNPKAARFVLRAWLSRDMSPADSEKWEKALGIANDGQTVVPRIEP